MVCPAPRDATRAITPEGVEKYYRDALKLQGKHSPHSWRSAFSTVAREAGKESDVVEAQLDHVVGTKVASAYDRSKRLQLRRELMRWYERQSIAVDGRNSAIRLQRSPCTGPSMAATAIWTSPARRARRHCFPRGGDAAIRHCLSAYGHLTIPWTRGDTLGTASGSRRVAIKIEFGA